MPLIWATNPEVKLCIVGKDPPIIVRKLGENPLITVTGTVSDICPYLQKSTIAIVPLTYGAGIQFKVLEAMACSTPVVASPKAVMSLGVQPGKDVLVASEPDEFAAIIIKLLADINLQQQVGNAGRMYVEKNHQWSSVAAQLEGVYNEVINTKHQSNK
jgi:glycosyltransferase involved in cell wall biosynthesis